MRMCIFSMEEVYKATNKTDAAFTGKVNIYLYHSITKNASAWNKSLLPYYIQLDVIK